MVAEKFHALAVRGITNGRLKDYYDLWLIANSFELDRAPLAAAVRQTFARRETALPQEKPTGFSEAYVETWGDQWRTFLTRERMAAAPEQLATVVADLERFVLPLIEEAEGDWRRKPHWLRFPRPFFMGKQEAELIQDNDVSCLLEQCMQGDFFPSLSNFFETVLVIFQEHSQALLAYIKQEEAKGFT